MSNSEFAENVDRLFKQSETGKVDAKMALKVFSDAYSAVPRGGSIEKMHEYTSFKDGSRAWHIIDMDESKAYLHTRTHTEEKGMPVCNNKEGFELGQCMEKVYGKPKVQIATTTFEGGLQHDLKVARYNRFGMVVEDKISYWAKEVDGLRLERKEINNRMDLTISRKREDGSTQHLTFFKPNTIFSAPTRFSGMRIADPNGQITDRRNYGRFIGMHGYER
ncbi:MAG: hypothetical protein K2X77_29900 [Candidatus Obscuribacterales bacterium]|jgi:hypothetical protein|nr:hypothetical protein [Candidatus Obscuribacterales bacterium]